MTSADSIALELGSDGARIEWAADGLRALAPPGSRTGTDPVWQLEGDLDWDAVESLRVVSAAFEDGRLLVIAAAHPQGAEGHDETRLRGALVEPDGEIVELVEALLSTEYDAAGAPARIGLELYTDPDALPLRVAADRESGDAATAADRAVIPMSFRMEGARGAGLLELISRG